MDICIVGWYFYDSCYSIMREINKTHNVSIISHKFEFDKLQSLGIPYVTIENIGLEFGAYDYYLKNIWDKESDVLFMHDDVEITDIQVFDRIEKDMKSKNIDQSYIFTDIDEEKRNGGQHGRVIYMSAKLLNFMLNYKFKTEESIDHVDTHHNIGTLLKGTGEYSGFWYDPNNNGHTTGKPPIGVRHYNEMIYTFHRTMGRIRDRRYGNEKMNVVNRSYYPEIHSGRRGKFKVERPKK
jgi:hypothetical protein